MNTAIALNRFGLGARPGDAARMAADPQGWLTEQLQGPIAPALPAGPLLGAAAPERVSPAAIAAGSPDSGASLPTGTAEPAVIEAHSASLLSEVQRIDRLPDNAGLFGRFQRACYVAHVQARVGAALATERPLVERLVHFWSNHFALSADRRPQSVLAGPFENEAIRPNVLGRFSDLLLAVEQHPAMLLFLDQARSIGPQSAAARRAASRQSSAATPGPGLPGLNENLAREILELHTLGVQGGYAQIDVQELARALTGWTITGYGPRGGASAESGRAVFLPDRHEPGERRLLGGAYPAAGQAQSRDMLLDLARHRATARHLAGKLARHFVADAPPAELVDHLAASFLDTDGDLPSVYRALLAHPLAWRTAHAKFKSPWDFVISALRAVDAREAAPRPDAVAGLFTELGQRVWTPGSPAGYADTVQRWAAPDALLKRVEWGAVLGRRSASRDPRELALQVLPGVLSSATRVEIARAESPAQGLALLFASAEFMRR